MSSLLTAFVLEPALRRLSFASPPDSPASLPLPPSPPPPPPPPPPPDSGPSRAPSGRRRHASSPSALSPGHGQPVPVMESSILLRPHARVPVPVPAAAAASALVPSSAPSSQPPETEPASPARATRRQARSLVRCETGRGGPTRSVSLPRLADSTAADASFSPHNSLPAAAVVSTTQADLDLLPRMPQSAPATGAPVADTAPATLVQEAQEETEQPPQDDSLNPASRAVGRLRQASISSSRSGNALPADDGMRILREQMHRIRDMALSSEEKALRMHALMTADYERLKSFSLLSEPELDEDSMSNANSFGGGKSAQRPNMLPALSALPTVDPENPYNIHDDDLEPTYCPPSPTGESDHDDADIDDGDHEDGEAAEFGCQHYKRNIKVQCSDCRRWYTCRLCHDDQVHDHKLVRKEIKNMLCMNCNTPQVAAEYCRRCGLLAAHYYCSICKLWDNDSRRRIYHCDDCGICRRGEGLGKDYVHCKKCNVCISIAYATTHRCVERATDCDCPICGDYMFTSSASVVAMKCGHYIHQACYDAYMEGSYRCPICNRSAINMEIQWRKLDHCIEVQPMPEQYRNTKAWITCNDCAAKSCVSFHWLGNKCAGCDSYNTNESRIINGPESEQDDTSLRREVEERGRNLFEAHTEQTESRSRPVNFRTATANSNVLPLHLSHQPSLSNSTVNTGLVDSAFPPASPVSARPALEEEVDMADAEDNVNAVDADDEDDAGFWGEGMSPPNWNINPREWASQKFFAKSDDGGDDEELGTSPGIRPGRYFADSNMPWRSTRLFGSPLTRAVSADAVSPVGGAEDDDDKRSSLAGWRIGPNWPGQVPAWLAARIPRPPFGTSDIDSGTGDDSGLGWRDWREWRLRAPAGGWTSPKFFANRFGGREGDLDNDEDGGETDGDYESDSDSLLGIGGEPDDGDDDEVVDLLDLPGHR